MNDARALTTIRSWINSLTLTQELIVLAGVVLFLVGLFAQSAIAFILAAVAAAYLVVVTRRRSARPEPEEIESPSPPTTEEELPDMKKLVFDDFQPEGRAFRVEVVGNTEGPVAQSQPASASAPSPAREYQFRLSDFCDVSEDVFHREVGPRSEFSFLMKKVLGAIKEANFAHSVVFFWINREKNQLVLESYVSDSEKFTTHRRREIASDLISQVATSGEPRLLSRINVAGQLEMLGYYEAVEPVRSFVAVPVFFPKQGNQIGDPVGVLALDCMSEDAYGPETLTLLGQFTKLVSALIRSYTDKYDLLIDSEVLRAITRTREQLNLDFSLFNIVRTLSEETSRLVAWDYVTVVLYDEARKAWVVQYVMNRMNDAYIALSQEIDPHQSLVGLVLQTSSPRLYDTLHGVELPRFYRAERVDSKGALAILPINSVHRCYGALVVESKDQKTYSESDVRLLQKLVETASWALEILSLNEVVNNYLSMDETTGVAARKYFMGRMQEEVQRANDFGAQIAVAMISIDGMNDLLNRYGKEGFDFSLQSVGRMVKSSVRAYDFVGRYDFNQFAVLLVHTTANEAYLWAEKLRKNIASTIINIDQRSFSVTVSIGVCAAAGEATDVDLLGNATQVLRKAAEAGGNMVRVY